MIVWKSSSEGLYKRFPEKYDSYDSDKSIIKIKTIGGE